MTDAKNPEVIPQAGGVAPVSANEARAEDPNSPTTLSSESPPESPPEAPTPKGTEAHHPVKRPIGEKLREDAVAMSTELRERAVAQARELAERVLK